MEQILEIKNSLLNEEFDSLEDSQQRVDYFFDKISSVDEIRENVRKYLSDHKNNNSKSLEKSQIFRQKGNVYYDKNNLEYALYYYTSAIMCAPYPSQSGLESNNELTYAYISRSLIFFRMKAYENSLFDINCALNLSEFSIKFEVRLEIMSQKVLCLYRLKRYLTAIRVVSSIIQLIPCLPKYNEVVIAFIQFKDQITNRMNEESDEESDETKQLEIEFQREKEIEKHLKNIDTFLSPDLQLCESQSEGRHYKATNDISKGQLLVCEESKASILFSQFFTTHCQYCFKNVGYKCWPCPDCSQVVFCDNECLENACHHSYECGIIDVIQALGHNHHILYRLILLVEPQMAIDLSKETPNKRLEDMDKSEVQKLNYLKFTKLVDHRNKYCLKTKVASICRSIQLAFIFDFFDELRPKDKSIVTHLKELSSLLDTFNYKIFVNVFGMYERIYSCRPFRGEHIGNSVMFDSSFFNHSCFPNTYWVFNGQHISIAAVENIKKGDGVTISYGPYSQNMSIDERQDFLMKRYFFECKCRDCIKGVDI